ncbi:MAG: DUF3467 domain-containing protein [Bacteroidaceae bacterium]|nr:DUF3467 domain-containing protein [Bacteroidaceae bacterium]
MENQKPQNGLQIELTPDVAGGVYSNLAIISHGKTEMVLDFVSVMPGMPKANVKSRIVMNPEHAKRLLFALQDNIIRYEKTFGTIELAAPQEEAENKGGKTANPFGV